ncbi:tetratricopeptide repeat protein [Niveibacterium umoris]|uniref:protein O-GlcNAc transferase n=1 Tax=Niveibacterium umoris TaxID=1193620 RepID=A0A840BPN9_9RHOO|nr:tetratricopeptide repeat protein [Niveibacterium umoris]MBB4014593.1 putative O-linked N-acetylglucosamine transferase (SPINDLY family) [Niveibacterium umoris]
MAVPSAEDRVSQALAAWSAGDRVQALSVLDEAARAGADSARYHMLCGIVARQTGQLDVALAAYRRAIEREPELAEAWFNLANTCVLQGDLPAAVEAYEATLRLNPAAFQAWNALGSTLTALQAYARASQVLRHAVRIAPDFAESWNNLGRLCWQVGEVGEAIAAFRRAVALAPERAEFHSNLLTLLHYDPDCSGAQIAAEHRAWAERHAPAVATAVPARQSDPRRRLRIGYVSSNFRHDAAGVFIASALCHHDADAFEVYAYCEAPDADALTARMRAAVAHWTETWRLDDAGFARRVEEDAIDILIDLNGHTGRGRLRAFSRRLAPLQFTWLGYEGATGVPAMDALIADANVAPVSGDLHGMEGVIRLPYSFQCWTPPDAAPTPAPRSSREPVFGCFNKPAKLNLGVLASWASILLRVPDARLVLKSAAYADPMARERVLAILTQHGVAAPRIEFRGASSYAEMMRQYADIDVALDPFPFSGGATSCDALWMGVPVVTLRGERFSANHTVSHLAAAGFPEWIADSQEAYARIASRLVTDREMLAMLRLSMRGVVAEAPLCNGRLFTRHLEIRLRTAWQAWCAEAQR